MSFDLIEDICLPSPKALDALLEAMTRWSIIVNWSNTEGDQAGYGVVIRGLPATSSAEKLSMLAMFQPSHYRNCWIPITIGRQQSQHVRQCIGNCSKTADEFDDDNMLWQKACEEFRVSAVTSFDPKLIHERCVDYQRLRRQMRCR